MPETPICLCLKTTMSCTDLLDYLCLGTILKVMALFHIDLLDLNRIWKVYLTEDFKVWLCYESKSFPTFASNTQFL